MARIELEHIHKGYGRHQAPAVDDVSLVVEQHTLLALLGPSGSGKSTILKLIAGIEHPDRGDISIDGRSVLAQPAHRRAAVLMFQKAYLFPFLTAGENIAFGLRARGVDRATIRAEVPRMLALVGLPGLEQRRPSQLSGGEQQRVALARALVVRPRVLMLDEPFSSLDPAVRQSLQEAVCRIQRELEITTVIVTHDRAEALAMADRVALLERGALLAHDTPNRLFERPPTSRAARQMGVDTFLHGEVAGTTLRSPLGPLALAAPGCAEGPHLYAIRPEHIRLLRTPAENTVAAEVRGHTFRGEHVEVLLHAGGRALRARATQPFGAVGEHVYAQFPPEHLFPVVDDEPPSEPEGAREHA